MLDQRRRLILSLRRRCSQTTAFQASERAVLIMSFHVGSLHRFHFICSRTKQQPLYDGLLSLKMTPLTLPSAAVTAKRIGPFTSVGGRYGFPRRLALWLNDAVRSLQVLFVIVLLCPQLDSDHVMRR